MQGRDNKSTSRSRALVQVHLLAPAGAAGVRPTFRALPRKFGTSYYDDQKKEK